MDSLPLVRVSNFPRHNETMVGAHMEAVRFSRVSAELKKTSSLVPFLRRN
jgi:hypothetical protein